MSIPQTPGAPPPADVVTKPTILQRTLRAGLLLIFLGGFYALVVTGRGIEALAAFAAMYVAALLASALNFASARICGRRIILVRWIGFGRRLRFRANGKQLICWSAVPLAVTGRAVETERSLGRGRHATLLLVVLLWIVIAAAGLLVVPDPGSVYFAVMVLIVLVLNAWSPDRATGLRGAAKLLSRPDARSAPAVADPRRVAAVNAAIDAQFGDFDSAQAVLARLEADPEGAEAAALVRIDIAAARGDFDAALALPWPPAAPDAPAHVAKQREAMIATRRARLILFAAERNPQMMYQALAEANALYTSVPRIGTAGFGGPGVRALLALSAGNIKQAQAANGASRGSAATPMALANALCDKALIESATGDVRGRGSAALAQAAQLAPWYPRIATVHAMISSRSMPLQAVPMGAPVYPPTPQMQQQPPMPTDPWDAPPA